MNDAPGTPVLPQFGASTEAVHRRIRTHKKICPALVIRQVWCPCTQSSLVTCGACKETLLLYAHLKTPCEHAVLFWRGVAA